MAKFIIIGLTPQGLSMLRVLSRAGHEVIAFTNTKKAVGYYSKYGEKRLFNSVNDLKTQINSIVNVIDEKITCIITSGELLALIISEYPDLYDICDVQSGPLSLVKRLSNKNEMYNYALSKGLNISKFKLLSEYNPGDLKFPVILKRNKEFHLFFKIRIINNENELSKFIKEIPIEYYNHIIVQEYIYRDNKLNISFQGYFNKGECCLSFISDQKRKLKSGITSYLREITDAYIVRLIENKSSKFFKDTLYTGFAELEYLYSKNKNELYFIEVNTRPCGLQSILTHKYKNLSMLYNNDNNLLRLEPNPQPISWVNIARDIKSRYQNRDFSNISQFITSKYDILDWRDIRPFFYQLIK